ncbi:MAG: DUF4062 domain-containing protein [Planctomycetota bacterium]
MMRRIFVSSTAEDLKEHRKAVLDALVRMENLPIAMESFGARPGGSVEECKQAVRESDAVVVLVAHRYGWVPPVSDRGDGRRSITWIEVDEALAHKKPVFAFVVDADHEWTGKREQDLLLEALDAPEQQREIIERLRQLEALKKALGRRVRETFTTPEDLAAKVVPSVSHWLQTEAERPGGTGAAPAPPPRVLRVVHPLQPAQHFSGRETLLAELGDWWRDPASPDRVVALVAHGGAGKTAIAEQLLRTIREDAGAARLRGSVLVWSFYEDPSTGAFLEAAELLLGDGAGGGESSAGGRLQRLERALSVGVPHLLILDGLERVQSEGGLGRTRGELEDAQARNLLRSIAAGLGRARALITSRFELPDLEQWKGAGFRREKLDDLDRLASVGLLRAYGVRGDDPELARLALSAGRHALTLSVLGSYLRDFHGGAPSAAPSLDLYDASEDDPKAAKLHRVLQGYAERLPDRERDLLVRLSTFPRGVSVEILGYVIDAGGEIAGALVGCNQVQLAKLAQRLVARGLVFAYEKDGARIWTAHPFLRDWFRRLLGLPSEHVHEAVRSQLAPSLEAQPSDYPRDPKALDRYEALTEHSLLAGRTDAAWELFSYGIGRYRNLGWKLGDYSRGLRIAQSFAKDQDPTQLRQGLSEARRSVLLGTWGLFATDLGELSLAERVAEVELQLKRELADPGELSKGLDNAADRALNLGSFPRARLLAAESFALAESAGDSQGAANAGATLASALHALGEEGSLEYFARATEHEGRQLHSLRGTLEAEGLLERGERDAAREHAAADLAWSERGGWPRDQAQARVVLALCSLPEDPALAREHLAEARRFVEFSGHMRVNLRVHHADAEIARITGDHSGAIEVAQAGLRLAARCGFGAQAIRLQVSLARAHLLRSEPRQALQHARAALDASTHEDCLYAWGEADAAHLCTLAHRAQDEPELALRRARQALGVRERIGHPEVDETRALIDELQQP